MMKIYRYNNKNYSFIINIKKKFKHGSRVRKLRNSRVMFNTCLWKIYIRVLVTRPSRGEKA